MEEFGDAHPRDHLGTEGSQREVVLEDIPAEATWDDIGLEELGPPTTGC